LPWAWHDLSMTSLPEPILRPATVADASVITALIDELMPFLTLHPNGEGAEKFIEHCRLPAIENYLSQSRYHYQLAHIDGVLAGVVAMRDNTHLFHMFVPRAMHRRGMARRLWQAARDTALATGNTAVSKPGFYRDGAESGDGWDSLRADAYGAGIV